MAKTTKKTSPSQPKHFYEQPGFAKEYLTFSVIVLLMTSFVWALFGARLHNGNADQSVNAFLFERFSTFQHADWPGQHTFLIKWPLFLLTRLFGYSQATFIAFTIFVAMGTVAGLVYVLSRIENRPLVLGTLYLALASVLILVPAMPYSGGILPVNMAMLTTRNIEYIFYIAALALLVRQKKILNWHYVVGVVLLGLLIASDKLFLVMSFGGAVMGIVGFGIFREKEPLHSCLRWFAGTIMAAVGAILVLAVLNLLHVTHIMNGSGGGPYDLVNNAHDLALGGFFLLTGLATNFGANPAFDAQLVKDMPHLLLSRIISLGGIGFVVNIVTAAAAVWASGSVIKASLSQPKKEHVRLRTPVILTCMLLLSTVAACVSFVVTKHYYVVDARYVTIALFAGFMSLTIYTAQRSWKPKTVVTLGGVCIIAILSGTISMTQTYQAQRQALANINSRDGLIAEALEQHNVDTLVGDYWRVVPTKLKSKGELNVTPLADCTDPATILSSKDWRPDLDTHSFAYILTQDGSLTNYPHCTLESIIAAYGRPNASVLIAGSYKQPAEQLLFYDKGAHKSAPHINPATPSTVIPTTIDDATPAMCKEQTDLNIVAHQDDDLLFMNPDVLHNLQAGHCERTIYITAGDAGNGTLYWIGREHGSEAAYNVMDGPDNDIWVERIVQLNNNAYATIANPRGNSRISLIFLHLPDGNVHGNGFAGTHFESLESLERQPGSVIHSVDGQSSYTSDQLTDVLSVFINKYKPDRIRTQANYVTHIFPDHSDHMAVGRFVKQALGRYQTKHPDAPPIDLQFYVGYPTHGFGPNISGDDLVKKQQAFFEYAKNDGSVCGSVEHCGPNTAYGAYLVRQYTNPN